jgi:hypothetical protein
MGVSDFHYRSCNEGRVATIKNKDMRRGEKSGLMKGLLLLWQQSWCQAFFCGEGACPSDGQVNAEGIHPMITAHENIPAMHQRNRLDDGQPQTVIVAAVAA